MKYKEINLSSASLEKKEEFEKKVMEEKTEVEGEKKNLTGKKLVVGEKIKELVDKFDKWWKKAPKKVKIITIAIPALLILGGSAFFFYYTIYGPRNRPPKLVSIETNYIAPKIQSDDLRFLSLEKPSLPRTEESPINGRLFTREEMEKLEERRAIAAIVSNHVQARPTSSLPQADLVYEALVEGGITRFLAIYWSNEPNKIGPIRSVRQYYIEWLSPFDPLFIYDGFAISNDPRVNAAGNLINYDIKRIYTAGAWRVSDRVAPHNEYSSATRTWEIAKNRGIEGSHDVEAWKFKSDASVENRNDRFKAKILFSNSDSYNPTWEYNKDTNMYYRSIGGVQDRDLDTNQRLFAKNIIIQEVAVEGPVDKYNRLIITTTGNGSAAILQDGKVIYGTWKKQDRTSRTKYYDNNGNEIQFNRGITWISMVRQLEGNFDIIEQ